MQSDQVAKRTLTLLSLFIIVVNIGFILACITWDWPQWWVNIGHEKSALGWLQGIELFALASVNIAIIITRVFHSGVERKLAVPFSIVFGFMFLTLDERFQFHERFRHWYVHSLHGANLFGRVENGNFVLLTVLFLSVPVFAHLFWQEREKKSVYYLIAAFIFSTLAITMDAATDQSISNTAFRLEQCVEEIFETIAEMFLLLFFVNQWINQLWHLERKNRV